MTKRLTKIGVNPDFQELSSFVHELPTVFETGGKVIYKGRNELKEFDVEGKKLIVKSYQLPHLLNRIIYNFFRASKAKRSYSYAVNWVSDHRRLWDIILQVHGFCSVEVILCV